MVPVGDESAAALFPVSWGVLVSGEEFARAKVLQLSRRLNVGLSQPLRNLVAKNCKDVGDLRAELLAHNDRGELDLSEMDEKAKGIEETAREIREAIKYWREHAETS